MLLRGRSRFVDGSLLFSQQYVVDEAHLKIEELANSISFSNILHTQHSQNNMSCGAEALTFFQREYKQKLRRAWNIIGTICDSFIEIQLLKKRQPQKLTLALTPRLFTKCHHPFGMRSTSPGNTKHST